MNVVGRTADAVTVTMLVPEAASVASEKNPGSAVGSVDDEVPK